MIAYVVGAVTSSGELVCRSVQRQGILHGAFWRVLWCQLVFNDAECSGMQSNRFLLLAALSNTSQRVSQNDAERLF